MLFQQVEKMREEILPFLKIGRKVKGYTVTPFRIGNEGFPSDESNRTTQAFSRSEDITNGVPQLIKNGKIEITWETGKNEQIICRNKTSAHGCCEIKRWQIFDDYG